MTPYVLHLVAGKTRAGKPIICATEIENVALICSYFKTTFFSIDDLLDALAVFEYLYIRAKKRDDPFAEIYERQSRGVRHLLTLDDYDIAKSNAGVLTVFDLRNLGQSLVRIEFKEL